VPPDFLAALIQVLFAIVRHGGASSSCFGTSDRSARDQCGSHRHNEFARDSLPLNVTIYVCHGRPGATLI
jgi:hypothetical protein